MEGNCTLVPGGSSALNLLKMRKAEKERCVVVFHMFDYSLNIILQGELMHRTSSSLSFCLTLLARMRFYGILPHARLLLDR